MDLLVMIEGEALDAFAAMVSQLDARPVYRLRIAVDAGQLKVKVDERTWTPPLGAVAVGEDAR